ncbi:MAG TPA: hydroxymethylbilane synthase [Planctomycetota bacterium]|nr:hydroxymethylbilane synthase [Planctomycetota bacterium]
MSGPRRLEAVAPRAGAPDGAAPAGRRYLPIGVDVSDLPCLVVGGGRVGTRKALKLAEAGAAVTVLAPEVSAALHRAVGAGALAWVPGRYAPGALDGFLLVVAATDDPGLNIDISRDAAGRRALCCVASPGRFSRVIFPAVCRAGALTVAVHSDGLDCSRSAAVRREIEGLLARHRPEQPVLGVLGVLRGEIPETSFAALAEEARGLSRARFRPEGTEDVLLLATCRRWECWFLASSTEAAVRGVRAAVHERCGVLLESCRPAPRLLSGAAARHHLLRVAVGLESELLGETDIVAQLREARSVWLPRDDSGLGRIFGRVLDEQAAIRAAAPAGAARRNWAAAVADRLLAGLPAPASAKVVVVGRGRMGLALADGLRARVATVVSVPARSGSGSEVGAGLPDDLQGLLRSADAAVLTGSRPGADALFRETVKERPEFVAVDLTGPRSLRRLGWAPCGADAAWAAAAGRAAFTLILRDAAAAAPVLTPGPLVRVGARNGALSRAQTGEAMDLLGTALPGWRFGAEWFETPGDRDRTTPLPEVTAGDFFTRDLDEALLAGRIDLAVHSAKDLPESLPAGLTAAALLPAFVPWECLVSRGDLPLARLPAGARVGTSSRRRQAGVLALRPDLVHCDIRGNVPDRLRQLDAGRYDALVLAAAGMVRLGAAGRIAQIFSREELPPAPGQGALVLVTREDAGELRRALAPLDLGDRRGLPWEQ